MFISNLVIIGILIILCCLVGFNIYLYLKKTDDGDDGNEEILDGITETLKGQNHALDTQKDEISQIRSGLAEFNYPLSQLRRYLSGGTLAGKFGEWGLKAIIRDIIPDSKIKEDHEIIEGSGNTVEFAIELDEGLLPIDAKFPSSLYDNYISASEKEEIDAKVRKKGINDAENAIGRRVKSDAQDISTKYMQRGITIDLGIMFIPSESLMQLIDRLKDEKNKDITIRQRVWQKNRILIMGPNTFAAYLISINMGFKSIVLNERAEEILQKFGELENEFRNFEEWIILIKKQTKTLNTTIQNDARINQMNKVIIAMEELSEEEE
jgi:DNA anti-recombination protein RmuC